MIPLEYLPSGGTGVPGTTRRRSPGYMVPVYHHPAGFCTGRKSQVFPQPINPLPVTTRVMKFSSLISTTTPTSSLPNLPAIFGINPSLFTSNTSPGISTSTVIPNGFFSRFNPTRSPTLYCGSNQHLGDITIVHKYFP